MNKWESIRSVDDFVKWNTRDTVVRFIDEVNSGRETVNAAQKERFIELMESKRIYLYFSRRLDRFKRVAPCGNNDYTSLDYLELVRRINTGSATTEDLFDFRDYWLGFANPNYKRGSLGDAQIEKDSKPKTYCETPRIDENLLPYENSGGNSGILGYLIGDDYVVVQFRGGADTFYKYTKSSAGEYEIGLMKELAEKGQGLNSYLSTKSTAPQYQVKGNSFHEVIQ
jgi:hypothetical protein